MKTLLSKFRREPIATCLILLVFAVILMAQGSIINKPIFSGLMLMRSGVTWDHLGNAWLPATDSEEDIGSAAVRVNTLYSDELFANKGADVASAASAFTLGADGNFYDITGSTGIDSIAAQSAGKVVALQFDGILTVTDGGNLKLEGNFVTAAGATLVLESDGVDWYELGRAGGNIAIAGAATFATTVGVTGVTTLTGGVAFATATPFIWADGGPSVLATSGTNQAPTNGPRQWVQIQIPYNVTLTGIGYLVGSVGGTDSVVVELYNSAGTAVARSIATDTEAADLVGTAAQFQSVAFSSTYAAVAGRYYISIQMNGTTAKLRTYPIPGSGFVANTAAGTFKTGAAITPGTTFVADEGPISFVY